MTTATTNARTRLMFVRGLAVAGGILLVCWVVCSPVRVWLYLRAAQQSLDAGKPEIAIGHLAAARQLASDNAEVMFWQARAYRKAGRVNEVEQALEQTRQAGFDSQLVEREWLLTLAQSGRLAEVEPHLPRLLQSAGAEAPEVCEAYVRGYQVTFRFDAAAALLDAWQKDCPDSPRPHALRGRMAQIATRWELAVEEFRRAIELGDDGASTQLGLALSLTEIQEFAAALPHFERAIHIEPQNLEAQLGMASCLMSLGRNAKAADAYRRAVELDPDNFDAHLGLARLDLEQGQAERSVERLEPLLRAWPGDAAARYTMAQSLLALDREKEAERHLEKWKSADAAVQQLEERLKNLRNDPANVAMRYEIGKRLLEHYSRSMGEKYLLSVLQLEAEHAGAHAALADYYARSNEPARANVHARRGGSGQ